MLVLLKDFFLAERGIDDGEKKRRSAKPGKGLLVKVCWLASFRVESEIVGTFRQMFQILHLKRFFSSKSFVSFSGARSFSFNLFCSLSLILTHSQSLILFGRGSARQFLLVCLYTRARLSWIAASSSSFSPSHSPSSAITVVSL